MVSDASGEARSYPAIIERPVGERFGAVLLIGGGYAHDEHWTVPASYTIEGKTTPVTINGTAHKDAEIIARALVERGFVVMRQSMVHTEDAREKKNPALAMGVPIDQSIDLYHDALTEFREREPLAKDRIVLIGHSLGAIRTARIADEGVIGVVWLAPAYATPAAAPGQSEVPVIGGPWPIESVRTLDLPLLALFGEMDTHTMHAEPLSSKADVVVYDGLGHNLSEEDGALIGPITDEVVQQIASWCEVIALGSE